MHVHEGAIPHRELVNLGQADLLLPFPESAVDRDIGLFAGQAKFFHDGLVDDGTGRAGIDRQVAGNAIGDDRQSISVLVLDELGTGIAMRDDVSVERIEGDSAGRGLGGEEAGRENGKKDRFSHESGGIIGALQVSQPQSNDGFISRPDHSMIAR